jgi:hypothetical protein
MEAPALKKCEHKLLKRTYEILPILKHLHDRSEAINSEAQFVNRVRDCYQRELADIQRALGRLTEETVGSVWLATSRLRSGG